MTDWQQRRATAREDYRDILEQRHFDLVGTDPMRLAGTVDTATTPRSVEVEIGDTFPYHAPRVFLGGDDGQLDTSWHRDYGGALCLYTDDDQNVAPWMDVDAFLNRIAGWFDQTEQGWPADVPMLDADRYLPREATGAMVIYNELDSLVDRYVRLHTAPNNTTIVGDAETPPQRRKGGDSRRYAAVRDAGTLDRPIRTWDDVRAVVPDGDHLEQDVRDRRIMALILRYERSGNIGALVLRVVQADDGFHVSAYTAASDAESVLYFRRGTAREKLSNTHILIVGAGAVGSFTADLLARDGVGHIMVMDWQKLTPGNTVRHLCNRTDVGRNKAEAVAERIRNDHGTNAAADNDAMLIPDQALAAVHEYDLVIDATANGSVTAMLHEAARITNRTVLSVCIKNDGDVSRVDLLPPLTGQAIPPTPGTHAHAHTTFFEGGCGDPVSPTAPHAVLEAAALATRHAVGLLTNCPVHPAGQAISNSTPSTS